MRLQISVLPGLQIRRAELIKFFYAYAQQLFISQNLREMANSRDNEPGPSTRIRNLSAGATG